jgi:transcriptional regulator with XRE-family HTH domain
MGVKHEPVRQPGRAGRPSRRARKELRESRGQEYTLEAETGAPREQEASGDGERLLENGGLSPFSQLLQHIVRRERNEIARVAEALGVSENTVYRWLNGTSRPQEVHLKHLLDVLPQHRRNLIYAIEQTFPGALAHLDATEVREVQKEIYYRVHELRSTTADDDARRWQIILSIFEHALLHLDSERRGMAITYAQLMPPHEDGIHSLYEAEMRGTPPWPFSQESKAYLGSTTLAGTAAMLQRMLNWDDLDQEARKQFTADDFEHSACACPVMFAGRIAGVLIVSSTEPGFFTPTVTQAVLEYARLLALAMKEENFYPGSLIHLRPMPDWIWQRAEIGRIFMNRVIACARNEQCSRSEAERRVRMAMEHEFEQRACDPPSVV